MGVNRHFRKKTTDIFEARNLTPQNLESLERWSGGQIKGTMLPRQERCIDVQTIDGEQRAEIGDWIIKRPNGMVFVCKPDIFSLEYEPVEWV